MLNETRGYLNISEALRAGPFSESLRLGWSLRCRFSLDGVLKSWEDKANVWDHLGRMHVAGRCIYIYVYDYIILYTYDYIYIYDYIIYIYMIVYT